MPQSYLIVINNFKNPGNQKFGFDFDRHLIWAQHLKNKWKLVNSKLRLFCRLLYSKQTNRNELLIYKAIIIIIL